MRLTTRTEHSPYLTHDEFETYKVDLQGHLSDYLEIVVQPEIEELHEALKIVRQNATQAAALVDLLINENLKLAVDRDKLQGILERMVASDPMGQFLRTA